MSVAKADQVSLSSVLLQATAVNTSRCASDVMTQSGADEAMLTIGEGMRVSD